MQLTDVFISQLDALVQQAESIRARAQYDDWSGGLEDHEYVAFVTRCRAAIRRISGENSAYTEQCEDIAAQDAAAAYTVRHLYGVVTSLRADLEAGYLSSLSELVRGELFADFLEMSEHLRAQGYKDAAAVIAGSALEAHLRMMCERHGVEVVGSDGRPKKADLINSELCKAGAYSKLDQKNVTSWLGLRNDAAHGNYDAYGDQQVRLMSDSVRDFITRYPA